MNEYTIEWVKGRNHPGLLFRQETAWKSKILRYAESHPEDIKIVAENQDGSIFVDVPVNCIRMQPTQKSFRSTERSRCGTIQQCGKTRSLVKCMNNLSVET